MGRKVWRRPFSEVQKFVANEYVAACEGGGTKYWFQCNAGSTHSGDNVVYEETNGEPGLQRIGESWNPDRLRSMTYYACDKLHPVGKNENFLEGYVVQDMGWFQGDKVMEVLIWTENGTNTHCTTELNKETWEPTQS